MGKWSREEIEEAFENYQKVALEAFTSGNYGLWADLFTEDCTYVEHHWGRFGGREAVKKWITMLQSTPPLPEMKYFPIEWYVIDEDKGWVVCAIWNRMSDPGDGSIHQEQNWSLIKYAGNGKWKYEEDIYNPLRFMEMLERWQQARERTGLQRAPVSEMPKTQFEQGDD